MKRLVKFAAAALVFVIPALGFGITLRLTGNSMIPPAFVEEKLRAMLQNLYGPDIEVRASVPALVPPDTQSLTVPVILPNKTEVHVEVTLTAEKIPLPREMLLLFSNHPEILKENGVLFTAGLIFLRPVRLNYYHENGPGEAPRAITIRLDNKNGDPAVVHVLEARAAPGKDEITTGHQASALFLTRETARLGAILSIPPRSTVILSRQVAKGGELVTGFLELLVLKGHPLELAVLAEDPEKPLNGALLESPDPHARGAYEMTRLSFQTSFRAGDAPKNIVLGDLPLRNLLPGKPLKGSYGMIWEGEIEIFNPYSEEETVPIYFQPRGGAATATFFINDFFREVGPTRAFEKVLLAEVPVPPRSRRTVHVTTMPEGGSSYPIFLSLGRPEGP